MRIELNNTGLGARIHEMDLGQALSPHDLAEVMILRSKWKSISSATVD